MIRRFVLAVLTIGLMLSLPLDDCWGRGGHGGGRGGGRGGGGFSGGVSRGGGGGFDGGASRGGGGFDGGASRGGRGGGFGGAGAERSPGGFGGGRAGESSGAQRSRGGLGGAGSAEADRSRSGFFGGAGSAGAERSRGGLGASAGAGGNRFSSPTGGQLNNFLGLPSDEGMHGLGSPGAGRGNVGVAGDTEVAQGRPGVGAGGLGRPGVGAGGVGRPGVGAGGVGRPGVGPGGVGEPGVRADRARLDRTTPSNLYRNASAVRGNFHHWDVYGRDWYAANPGAWHAAAWGAGAAWHAATWNSVGAWMSYYPTAPTYYDYGNNITYQDDNVYVNGDDVGTADQYYDQAASLAASGAQAEAQPDEDWLPLGVFALTKPDQTQSVVTIQLAVNKQGVIRGNYTDTKTGKTQLIQGSADKETQRVAFTVGDNKNHLVETGLYNLTKDEAPVLLHVGKDRTEQWMLVRLEQGQQQSQSGQ